MLTVTRNQEARLDPSGRLIVGGFDLRYALTVILAAEARTMSVDELGDRLHRAGFATNVRRSKAISDALRAEIRKGRAIKINRGLYRIDQVPRSTLARIRSHVRLLHDIAHRAATAPEALAQPSPPVASPPADPLFTSEEPVAAPSRQAA